MMGEKRKIFIAFDSFTRGKNPCRGLKFPQLLGGKGVSYGLKQFRPFVEEAQHQGQAAKLKIKFIKIRELYQHCF